MFLFDALICFFFITLVNKNKQIYECLQVVKKIADQSCYVDEINTVFWLKEFRGCTQKNGSEHDIQKLLENSRLSYKATEGERCQEVS